MTTTPLIDAAGAGAGSGNPWTAVAAYVAVIASLLAVSKQAFDLARAHKKERVDIQIALDQQPLVREQLEVGNMRGAVETLNMVIAAQAAQLARQDDRLSGCEKRERELEEREELLERERDQWAARYREQERTSKQLAKAAAELRKELEQVRVELYDLRAYGSDEGPDSVL